MPFSGYLVSIGRFNLWAVGVAGAFGCVVGSLVAYWVGMYGGRPLIERYGRYVLGLAYVGQKLGEQWNKDETLKTLFHRFDFIIGIVGALVIAWWVWRHVTQLRQEKGSRTENAQ